MSIKIRKGKIEDLKEIASIEAACFPVNEAATEEALKGRLSVYPDYFYILEKDKKIVSFVNGMATDSPNLTDEMYENPYLHKDKGQWQMIFGVNTLPEYRKKGVVLTCKDVLVLYYEKFGFKNEGVSESTHGGVVWYEMRLKF